MHGGPGPQAFQKQKHHHRHPSRHDGTHPAEVINGQLTFEEHTHSLPLVAPRRTISVTFREEDLTGKPNQEFEDSVCQRVDGVVAGKSLTPGGDQSDYTCHQLPRAVSLSSQMNWRE